MTPLLDSDRPSSPLIIPSLSISLDRLNQRENVTTVESDRPDLAPSVVYRAIIVFSDDDVFLFVATVVPFKGAPETTYWRRS